MIIYFTGTGNSRRIANVLAKELGDEIADASFLAGKGEAQSYKSSKPYVFVCPTYAWQIPHVFRDWIAKCTFTGTQKAYFVMTCGDSIGKASIPLGKLCETAKLQLMGVAKVDMPENFICMFSAPAPEKSKQIIAAGEAVAKELAQKYIANGQPFPKTIGSILLTYAVHFVFYKLFVNDKAFYSTDACIGCGICAKSCPMGNITIADGKPVWQGNCTQCQACINICPRTAIEYGKKTEGKQRYFLK